MNAYGPGSCAFFFISATLRPLSSFTRQKGGMDMLRHLQRKDRKLVSRQYEQMRRYYRELLDQRKIF